MVEDFVSAGAHKRLFQVLPFYGAKLIIYTDEREGDSTHFGGNPSPAQILLNYEREALRLAYHPREDSQDHSWDTHTRVTNGAQTVLEEFVERLDKYGFCLGLKSDRTR